MASKKKIVHVVNTLEIGGVTKVVLDLCCAFQEDFEFSVIAISNKDPELAKAWPQTITIHTFNFAEDKDYSLRGYLKILLFKERTKKKYQALIDLIQLLEPDIIHAHLQPRELWALHMLNPSAKERLLYTDHSTRIKNTDYRWINRVLLASVYQRIYSLFNVVAVSDSVDQYHKLFHIVSKRKRHWLVRNSVDTNLFIPPQKPTADTIGVVYVARLHHAKGHETLIRAWRLIKSAHSCKLTLVGDGDERKALEDLIAQLRPHHPVVFTGNQNDVIPYLQTASIAVFPSTIEGLPLALLEKMSCGLPVIASNISEFRGIIHDNENGLFFETGNVSDLAEKLMCLIEDAAARRRLGTNARQFVIDNYSTSRTRNAYREIYDSMIALT